MTKDIDALKKRLNERAALAKASERAVGLIEDIDRSIRGAGILKSGIQFTGGMVVLRVLVEPENVIRYEDGSRDIEIIGIDLGGKDGDEAVELMTGPWGDVEIANCLTMLGEGLGTADIAATLSRGLKDVAEMVEHLREIGGDDEDEVEELEPVEDPEPERPAEEQSIDVDVPPLQPWGSGPVGEGELARQEKLWDQGLTVAEIAKDMGIKPKRVSNSLTRFRERFPKRKLGAHLKNPAKSPPPCRHIPLHPVPRPATGPAYGCRRRHWNGGRDRADPARDLRGALE